MEEPRTYFVLDKITPQLRSILSFLLFFTGFVLQITARNFFLGLPFIIGCFVINLIKSISIKRESASEYKWEEVTPERIAQVYSHCQRIKKFKTAGVGCLIGVVIAAIFFFSALVPAFTGRHSVLPYPLVVVLVDTIILFSGLFLSGNKSAWMPGNLDLKTEILMRLLSKSPPTKDPLLKLVPYLEVGKTKTGSFPNDARMLVRFIEAPESFIGVQAQISINNVKSTAYPYFYAVIVAKPDFKLFDKFGSPILKNITIEHKETGGVDVIVIRQTTTKTSGYHTNESVQEYILSNSINLAKSLLSKKL